MKRTSVRPKLLFVSARLPIPFGKGDAVRAYGILSRLAQFFEATVLAGVTAKELEQLETEPGHPVRRVARTIVPVQLSLPAGLVRAASHFIRGASVQERVFLSRDFVCRYGELTRSGAFEVVHFNTCRVAALGMRQPALPYRQVIDFVDSLALNLHRRSEVEKGVAKAIFVEESKRVRRLERDLALTFRSNSLISSRIDNDFIGARATVIPNCVSQEFSRFRRQTGKNRIVVFSGNMGYFPNVHAVTYFLKTIWPGVIGRVPDAQFHIVGRGLTRRLQRLFTAKGAVCVGEVRSMGDYLSKCDVAVAPMQAGSGMQNKILEAMAVSVPVVTTEIGLGSIEAVHGRNVLVATSPADFTEQVVYLLCHSDEAGQMGERGRTLIEDRYVWARYDGALRALYQV